MCYLGADSMIGEDYNSQAARVKKRLERNLKMEKTVDVFACSIFIFLLVIAPYFPR